MSDIQFNCPKCGHSLVVDAAGVGMSVPCPECNEPLVIPGPEEQAAVPVDKVNAGVNVPPDANARPYEEPPGQLQTSGQTAKLRSVMRVVVRVLRVLVSWLATAVSLIGWVVRTLIRWIVVVPVIHAQLAYQYRKTGSQAYRNKIDEKKGAEIRKQLFAIDNDAEEAGASPAGEHTSKSRISLLVARVSRHGRMNRLFAKLGKELAESEAISDSLGSQVRRVTMTKQGMERIRSARPKIAAVGNFALGVTILGVFVWSKVDNMYPCNGNLVDLYQEISRRGDNIDTVNGSYQSILKYVMLDPSAASELKPSHAEYHRKELFNQSRKYRSGIATNLYCYESDKFGKTLNVLNYDGAWAILSIVLPFNLRPYEYPGLLRIYQTANSPRAYTNENGQLIRLPETDWRRLVAQGEDIYEKKSPLCEVVIAVSKSQINEKKYAEQGKTDLGLRIYLSNLEYRGPFESEYYSEKIRWYRITKNRYRGFTFPDTDTVSRDRSFNCGLYDSRLMFRTAEDDTNEYISAILKGYDVYDKSGKTIWSDRATDWNQ